MEKITRHQIIGMFETLGSMALGHVEELDMVMDNFNACRKVAEDFDKLKEELYKRVYEGVDEKRKEEFFELVQKQEQERDVQKRKDIIGVMKDSYADIFELYTKHLNAIVKLASKEVEIELAKVDADGFVKGVIKGKKDAPVHEIRAIFAPMFKEEEKHETDLTEIDEILK